MEENKNKQLDEKENNSKLYSDILLDKARKFEEACRACPKFELLQDKKIVYCSLGISDQQLSLLKENELLPGIIQYKDNFNEILQDKRSDYFRNAKRSIKRAKWLANKNLAGNMFPRSRVFCTPGAKLQCGSNTY